MKWNVWSENPFLHSIRNNKRSYVSTVNFCAHCYYFIRLLNENVATNTIWIRRVYELELWIQRTYRRLAFFPLLYSDFWRIPILSLSFRTTHSHNSAWSKAPKICSLGQNTRRTKLSDNFLVFIVITILFPHSGVGVCGTVKRCYKL